MARATPIYGDLRFPHLRIWQSRLLWGLHAVLIRLESEGDFAAVFRRALDASWNPLEVRLSESG